MIADASGAQQKPRKCEFGHSVSLYYEKNDNIYQSSTSKSEDALRTNEYSVDMECAVSDDTEYSVMFDLQDINFASNTTENYYDESVEFKYKKNMSDNAWIQFDSEYAKILMDNDDDSLYKSSREDFEWYLRYGRNLNPRSSAEFYMGAEQSDYNYDSSNNSEEWNWGLEYSYNMGGYSYLEFSYEKGNVDYVNKLTSGNVSYDTDSSSAGVGMRKDDSNTFTVAVSKMISIYPLKYLEVSAAKTDNYSNSTDYLLYNDGQTSLLHGYDDYDDINYSLYYMQDFNEDTSLMLYASYEKTDYPNTPVYINYLYYGDRLNTTLKYYYASLTHKITKRYSADFTFTLTDSESNQSYFVYKQKVYSLGLTRKL